MTVNPRRRPMGPLPLRPHLDIGPVLCGSSRRRQCFHGLRFSSYSSMDTNRWREACGSLIEFRRCQPLKREKETVCFGFFVLPDLPRSRIIQPIIVKKYRSSKSSMTIEIPYSTQSGTAQRPESRIPRQGTLSCLPPFLFEIPKLHRCVPVYVDAFGS
ncbi:hypothetical protein M0R45_020370 [Rubus argutus]|uniref:Uncharacterized protein n=1 Tax=Rubus argutus TaxID=59490 RepID=A0AAW1XBP2_RUBAR